MAEIKDDWYFNYHRSDLRKFHQNLNIKNVCQFGHYFFFIFKKKQLVGKLLVKFLVLLIKMNIFMNFLL